MAGFNHFGNISEAMDLALQQLPRKAAFDIQARYASTAPRDTGFMVNSAYVVTAQESTYGHAGSPPMDATLLPAVPGPSDKYTAYAAVGASYAIYVEMGTIHGPAQPAFYPAVDAVGPSFEAAVDAVQQKMEESAQ